MAIEMWFLGEMQSRPWMDRKINEVLHEQMKAKQRLGKLHVVKVV